MKDRPVVEELLLAEVIRLRRAIDHLEEEHEAKQEQNWRELHCVLKLAMPAILRILKCRKDGTDVLDAELVGAIESDFGRLFGMADEMDAALACHFHYGGTIESYAELFGVDPKAAARFTEEDRR